VLCPKYNDGEELKRTLSDLKKLKNVLSIAIVPVGITKFRQSNQLYPVTKKIAQETIEIVEEFNNPLTPNPSPTRGEGKIRKTSTHTKTCCSDEFFLLAEKPIPEKKYYGNYSQLEDGVGAIRLLLEDFKKHKKQLPQKINKPLNILFATSKLAKAAMDEISEELNKIKNLNSSVVNVKSKYWGENITVAGLITSEDLIDTIKEVQEAPLYSSLFTLHPTVIIPSVMLRPFTQDFLDEKTLDYVKKMTGLDFLVVEDCYSTKEIVDFINEKSK